MTMMMMNLRLYEDGLSTDEMFSISNLLKTIIDKERSRYASADTLSKINVFLDQLTVSCSASWLTTREIYKIHEEILSDEDFKNFFFRVLTKFLANMGNRQIQHRYCFQLARALCVDSPRPDKSFLPTSLKKYLPGTLFGEIPISGSTQSALDNILPWKPSSVKNIKEMLMSNPLLMMLIGYNVSLEM